MVHLQILQLWKKLILRRSPIIDHPSTNGIMKVIHMKDKKTKMALITLFVFLVLSVVLSGCTTQPAGPGTNTPTPTVTIPPVLGSQYTQDQVNLKLQWRNLWEDHVFWTRMVILNIADTPGGTNESVARLLQNYHDMEDAMRPYYGNETAEKYGDLLEEHLLIAADLVQAAKAGNSTGCCIT